MIEPLFMRFITDRVLLDTAAPTAERLRLLNLAGGAFFAVITLSAALNLDARLPAAPRQHARDAVAAPLAVRTLAAPAARRRSGT